MVKIRLKRLGQKKAPFYRIVVADERSPRNGREHRLRSVLTTQIRNLAVVKVDEEAAKKWIANGAKPTDTVARLFKEAGIVKVRCVVLRLCRIGG